MIATRSGARRAWSRGDSPHRVAHVVGHEQTAAVIDGDPTRPSHGVAVLGIDWGREDRSSGLLGIIK